MPDYSQQATFNRAALLLGLTSGEEVVAWADSIIASDVHAPGDLLTLSMVEPGDLSELRHALWPLTNGGESLAIIRALFDILRRHLQSGTRSAADTLRVLSQASALLAMPEIYAREIATLRADHMLAVARVTGHTSDVETHTKQWLTQFDGGEAAFFQESTC